MTGPRPTVGQLQQAVRALKADSKAAKNGRQRSSRQVAGPRSQIKTLTHSEADTIAYFASLSNPWEANKVGIPIGAALPTFKTKTYGTTSLSVVTASASGSYGGVSWAAGDMAVMFYMKLNADSMTVWQATALAASPTWGAVNNRPITAGRLVSAGIRAHYVGRLDERGADAHGHIGCADGIESHFLTDVGHAGHYYINYAPRGPFDLEFKDDGTENLAFDSQIGLFIRVPTATAAWRVEFVANVESNDDSPPADSYVHSDYIVTSASVTRHAGEIIMNNLADAAQVANKEYQKPEPGHADPFHSAPGPNWLKAVKGAADQIEEIAFTGAQVATAVAQLQSAYRTAGSAAALIM